jgi:hypothetical protein
VNLKGLGISGWGLGGAAALATLALTVFAQPAQPDWKALEPEMMEQFQAVLRLDTRNPPWQRAHRRRLPEGRVRLKAGIPAQIFALDANRSNVVARLKGNGTRKPILIPRPQRRRHRRRGEVEVPAV